MSEVDGSGDVVDEIPADAAAAEEDVLLLEQAELPVWEATGEPRVDTALELLGSLDPDDVHGHAEVFDEIHRRLRATLTDLDAGT